MKKGLMQTTIDKIPKDWKSISLENLADINKESIDPTREFPHKTFLYIDIDSIGNDTGHIRECREMIAIDAPSRARRVIHRNDVVMSTVRPYLKAFAIVPKEYDKQICSTGFAVLACRKNLYPKYLLYTLFSKSVIEQCNRMMVGGQYPALNSSQVARIKISLPPLPEQRKIAEILGTVDEAIEKVDEAIKKSERLKKGLMQELLTKGIGHREFKDTEIGKIPKGWEVVRLSTIFNIIDGDRGKNYPNSSDLLEQGHCLFLNAKNVTSKGMRFEDNQFISKEKDQKLRKGKLKRGDIVITTRGTVGNIGLYDAGIRYDHIRINSGMVIIRNKGDDINSDFYTNYLQSNVFQRQVERIAYGSAQPQLSVKVVKNMYVLEFDKDEQKKIVAIMKSGNMKIELQKKRKENLEKIKKGLMNDLLMGRKRVKL